MKMLRIILLWLALISCSSAPALAGPAGDALGIGAQAKASVTAGATSFGGTNLDPTLTPRLVTALLNAEAGTLAPNGANNDRYLVAGVGDSTMAGTRGASDLKANSYFAQMLPLLQAWGAWDENGFFGSNISTSTPSDVTIYDPRITVGAGIVFSSGGTMQTLGGSYFDLTNATGALTFAPTKAYDSCDIGFQAGSAGGTVGIQFGSGTVNSYVGPTNGFRMARFTTTLGTQTINFTKVSGSPGIVAVSCFNSAAPKVMLANMAKAGSTSRDWVTDPSGNGNRKPYLLVYAMRPHTVLINLGINDYSNGIPVSEFISNMQTIITQLKNGSDVVLGIPFPSSITSYPNQGVYVQAIRDLATANNLPLIDFGRLFVSWEFSNPYGRYSDSRHPTPKPGYQMTAKFMDRRLRQLAGF